MTKTDNDDKELRFTRRFVFTVLAVSLAVGAVAVAIVAVVTFGGRS